VKGDTLDYLGAGWVVGALEDLLAVLVANSVFHKLVWQSSILVAVLVRHSEFLLDLT
jgi:hypothetical protein